MVPIVVILQNRQLYADYMERMLVELGNSGGVAFCTAGDVKPRSLDYERNVALIDAEVQDGERIKLARCLKARGVPFVVYSTVSPGCRPTDALLTAGSFVKKPAHRDRIVAAITAARCTS